MACSKSKFSHQQATLFQTWGYSNSNQTAAASSLANHSIKRQEVLPINKSKSIANIHGVKAGSTTPDDDLDGLSQCFDDDNGLDLCQAIATEARIYLDGNFNSSSSPESLPGFDLFSGHNYIYPVSYPVREYQFNIIMKALVRNSLVVLPTGLGKTFIAAVVMYNFYRWYPQGKIVFMAPTRPLVAQQIQACYNITGTPTEDTAEMTGSISPARRKSLWEKKRVFFLTPHVLQNDLGRGTCFANDIVCLVFDEAHKALGNYAYCQVIKEIAGVKSNFRVLALSATPGGDMNAVQQIVTNLMISHVELRSEESPDIKPYVYGREIEKIVVPLGEEVSKTKQLFVQVLEGLIQRLCTQGVCWQRDATKVSKFFLLKARDQFRARDIEDKSRARMIEGDFALAISLYHAYELLQQHGILSFYNFMKEICNGTKGTSRGRSELIRHEKFMEMMDGLQQKIDPPEDADGTLNGSFLDMLTPKRRLLKSIPKPNSLLSSHPKLKKLEEIVVKHFESAKENFDCVSSQTILNTRVMIFSQYRDSVQEITAVLSKHQPLVKVMSFVGQNGAGGKGTRGLSQKEQLEVVQRFKSGGYNVLVSTSVGEEGLDIGDIDLIVCFDASNSPIRLVQRMGRTGRKRAGRIVMLVTEGKEDQTYKRSLLNKKNIHKKLLDATASLVLYDESPRMIPKHLNPYCLKMQITVQPQALSVRGVKRKSNEDKPKKVSKKKLNQNADNDVEISEASEEGGKQNGRKKSRMRLLKEKELDKVKAWRQSTVKARTTDIMENDSDDVDDFQLDGNEREMKHDGNDVIDGFVGEVNDAAESVSEKLKCELDDKAEVADLNLPDEIVDEKFSRKFVDMKIERADTENQKNIPAFDEDDDFICTQNISTFLPRSTPKRTFRPSSARLTTSNRRRRHLDVAIPLPPTLDDLDTMLDTDLKKSDLNAESKADSTENHIGGKHNSLVLSGNVNGTAYCNGDAKNRESIQSEKVITCRFEELDNPSLFNEVQHGISEGYEATSCENKTDKNFGDISHLDLFGDSLVIDSEDEFEDCPSPPVVSQIKTNEAKIKIAKAKAEVPCLDVKDDMFITNLEETKKNASIEVNSYDDSRESLFCLDRDMVDDRENDRYTYRHNSVEVNCLTEADEMDLQLADCIHEPSSESQLSVLSLKSRIANRCDSTVESTKRIDADVQIKSTVEKDKHSKNIFNLNIEPCPAEEIRNEDAGYRPIFGANEMAESMIEYYVDDSVSKGKKSSGVCSGSASPLMLDCSHSSDSNSNATMPSLATGLKNRNAIPLRDGIKSSKKVGFNVRENRSTSNVGTNTRQLNCNSNSICKVQNVENLNKNVNASSHMERESPVVLNKVRRRRGIGRIIDDSPSPVKESGLCSSDDELNNIMLRRKKTKKVGVFKSPPLRNRSQSSDEDFESERNSAKKDNQHVRTVNIKGGPKKETRIDFIDDEAELSGEDSGDEVYPNGSQYVMDSFIDDAVQMTQETPKRDCKGTDEAVDMAMVYRQSLFSPMYGALNFNTPAFKANKNRYKMAGRRSWHHESDDGDVAEESNSFVVDNEDEDEIMHETDGAVSFDESEDTKTELKSCISSSPLPRKKPRVKRILSSDDEEPVVFDHLRSKSVPEKSVTPMSIAQKSDETKQALDVTHNRPTVQKCNCPFSFPNDDCLDGTFTMLSTLLNSENFVPCFDFGLDLGPVDLESTDEPLQGVERNMKESETKLAEETNLHMFASSKVVASSQVGSVLRLQHHVMLTVCQQLGCDFVVSKRMGVLRKLQSDISNGSNSAKVMASIMEMTEHYSSTCVIIERDRIKGPTCTEKNISYTKYFSGLLAHLVGCQIKVLFSDSQEDTALLVYHLARAENGAAFGLSSSSMKLSDDSLEKLQKVLITVPYISYPLSLRLCNEYKCLKPLIQSSVEEIKARIPEVSTTLVKKILQYFYHKVLHL